MKYKYNGDLSEFRLTEQHIKLLRHAYVQWQSCETGAPEIDPKRPYGNSNVDYDVMNILEMMPQECPHCHREYDDDYPQKHALSEQAMKIHSETDIALQIVLLMGEFKPGLYRKENKYDSRSWKFIKE